MPDLPLFHASERVDKDDLTAVVEFPRGLDNLLSKYRFLDRQSRIMRGFRVELPDQTQFPGRVVVHGGFGLQYDGQHIFNEDQLNVSRTVTLEGSTTTFYLEVEFIESESNVDARAFWDSTVDQGFDTSGDALPDGQEFNVNVATRKTPDWQIVTPISTTGFERDQAGTLNSNKIPLAKLRTDTSNQITGAVNANLTTEKAGSTMIRYISTTQIVVREPWLFQVGDTLDVTDSSGTSASSVTTVNLETGLLTIAAITAKAPGAIVRVTSASSPDFITESGTGRYRRIEEDAGAPNHVVDWKDGFFQGDEIHGDILNRGLSSVTDRSDANLQSLKDYVDFLAAQIQEMKWGTPDPYDSGTEDSRTPPGLSTSLPTTPRYYDDAAGFMGARTAAVTVGDGTSSWGDFNGSTQVVLQKAHDSLPAAGGRIFLKRGTYSLTSDFNWTSTGEVVLEGEEGSKIVLDGGSIHITTTGNPVLKNLTIEEGVTTPSNIGILADTSNPAGFKMDDVKMLNAAFHVNCLLPSIASFSRVRFTGTSANMAANTLVEITGTSGTLSGTFSECDFFHSSYGSLATSLVDCVSGSPTLAGSLLNFIDCSFSTILLNAEGVHLGNTANLVNFSRCYFGSLLTLGHVRITGGSNINFTDCVGTDALAGFLQATDVDHLVVDGYINNNSVGFSAVECIDCRDVKISNCDVKVNSGLSLVNCAFRASSNTSTMQNIVFENNTIKGDDGVNHRTTGIIFDHTGGVSAFAKSLRVVNNTFETLEVGTYFASSGAGVTYQDVVVSNNNLYDYAVSDTVAKAFKNGVVFASGAVCVVGTINNNTFINMNVQDTNVAVGATPRSAVSILGTARNVNVNGNVIKRIGATAQALSNTCGVYLSTANQSSVVGNIIETVNGAGGFGIYGAGTLTNCVINSNQIDEINTFDIGSPTGIQASAWGVYVNNLTDTNISGNQISSIDTGVAGGKGVSVGSESATAQWNGGVIGNNKLFTDDASTQYGIFAEILRFRGISISGNSLYGDSNTAIEITAVSSGVYDNISINGNSFRGMTVWGINIGLATANRRNDFSISGNTIYMPTGTPIVINLMWALSINGNILNTEDDAECINVFNGSYISVTGNVVFKAGGSFAAIVMNTNTDVYVIQSNVVYNNNSGPSINTTTAAQLGTAMVTDNLVDIGESVGTDNTAGGQNLLF